jgi:hypothetical protein
VVILSTRIDAACSAVQVAPVIGPALGKATLAAAATGRVRGAPAGSRADDHRCGKSEATPERLLSARHVCGPNAPESNFSATTSLRVEYVFWHEHDCVTVCRQAPSGSCSCSSAATPLEPSAPSTSATGDGGQSGEGSAAPGMNASPGRETEAGTSTVDGATPTGKLLLSALSAGCEKRCAIRRPRLPCRVHARGARDRPPNQLHTSKQ